MNEDVEDRLRRLVNEQVDARLGANRAVPPFRPEQHGGTRRFAPWVPPLLAAACIAAVVGGSVAGTQLLSAPAHPTHTQVGTNQPTPVRPSSSALRTYSTAPTSTPRRTATSPPPHASSATRPTSSASTTTHAAAPSHHSAGASGPQPTMAHLGVASIALPAGWVARDLQRYAPPGGGFVAPGWCLTPKSTPVATDRCPVYLMTPSSGIELDSPNGQIGNPPQCFGGPGSTEQAGERRFGGRVADWRSWRSGCVVDGQHPRVEHYVVSTAPLYVLYSEDVDDAIHAAMAQIAAGSMLPGATSPYPFDTTAYVRSAHRNGASVHVTVDPVYRELHNRVVNPDRHTVRYDVPWSVWNAAAGSGTAAPKVRDVIELITDGKKVTTVYDRP